MKRLRSLVLAGLFAASPAFAQESNPVVVELFTSQGCSSCPPADAVLHELAGRDDVLPLALHVDYWDYIGWKDQFAKPSHTNRQKAYAHVGGRNMIYTPQMVVQGQEDVVGVKAMKLAELIKKHQNAPVLVDLDVSRTGADVTIDLQAVAPLEEPMVVQLVRYAPLREVTITRGELAGHTLSYANVVESMDALGTWDGEGTASYSFRIDGDLPAAVLVQRAGFGPIMTAARIE
jgi:hypothetical protein